MLKPVKRFSLFSRGGNAHVPRNRRQKAIQRLELINQNIASGINIEKFLAKGSALSVDQNGIVNIDYNNANHKKVAEAWLYE